MYALPVARPLRRATFCQRKRITIITKDEKWEEAGDKALREAERDRRRFKESATFLLNSYKERVKRPQS